MGDSRTDFDQSFSDGGATTPQPAPANPTDAGTDAADTDAANGSKVDEARQALRDNAGKVGQQASDKVRTLAEQGKARAGGALGELSRLLTDAAGQVDDKLGTQYGDYARQAAGQVQGFSDQVRDRSVDELLDDARTLVRKSPGVAIGAAAAIGFVVARLIQAGIDDQRGRS